MQRESKEVMAELVAKLSERLGPKPAQEKATEGKPKGAPAPNRDRLTVGVGAKKASREPSGVKE